MKKKVFVGRENELEQFRYTLKKLQAEHGQEERYANTILVYGVGGMGKTSLCNKFTDIIESEFPSLVHLNIDWDLCKNRGSTFTSEELLDTVARAFTDLFPKEMKPYLGAKKDIKKEQEKIERLLQQKMQALSKVAKTANKVTTVLTRSESLGTVVGTGLDLAGKGLSAIDEKYLKEKRGVSGESLRLYKDPVSGLAHRLLDCIGTITGKKGKQIVLILDTCELIVREEDWFAGHFLIPLVDRKKPGVLLIFSGRYNSSKQRAVVIDGQSLDIRGMADRMSYPPQRIDMQVFSRKDIEKYLKEMEGESPGDNVIDFVQTFSRGVPFAVDLLTNALERLGTERFLTEFGDSEFRDQLEQEITNEAVIRSVSRRFLKYCLDESGNKVDRDRLFAIAILGDTDTGILQAVWEVENPSDILEELRAKYALLIGEGKLHDVVKDFLIDYLMENENLRTEIAKPFAEKALPVYQKKYREECEEEPVWEDRFREDLWKDALQRVFNAMVWISPNEAVDFFIERGIELFLLSPSLIHKLKEPLDKFLSLEKGIRRKNRRKINAIMKALEDFSWDTWSDEEREGLINVLSFCNNALAEWELEPVHRAILQLIKGRSEYNLKNYEGAFNTLLERVDETPLDKSLRNKLAESLDDVGKKFCLDHNDIFFFSDKSLKAFDKAVKLNEKNASYLYHLGVMLRLGDEPQKAIEMYQKAIQIGPNDTSPFYGLGFVYRKLEDYDKAIEMFKKAIQIDSKDAYPFDGLGNVYDDLQNYEKAIEMYQKAIQIDPKFASPFDGLGNVYHKLEDYDKAIEMFKKAIQIGPKFASPLNGLGNVYGNLQDYDKAIEMFQKAIQVDPKYASPFYGLGNVYDDLQDYEKAIEMFQKAIQIGPKYASPLSGLGYVYYELEDYDKAIEMFQKAIQIDPKYASPLNGLGIVYHKSEDYDKAIEMYQKAIQIDPKDNYPYNGMGYTYLVMDRYTDAITYFQKSIEVSPTFVPYVNLGIAYYRKDEPDKGIESFEKGLSCADKSKKVHDRLNKVTALSGLNKTEDALNLLTTISEKKIPKGFLKDFFTDWNMLSTSPRPPQGMVDFIRQAKEILNYKDG